jgi:hypothetical protein
MASARRGIFFIRLAGTGKDYASAQAFDFFSPPRELPLPAPAVCSFREENQK